MKGLFITVEGGEGVGKTSFIQALATQLTGQGKTVVTTREPGGTKVGDAVRAIFIEPGEVLTPEAELMLISAGRAQHTRHLIMPAVDAGKWVLCDRYADSSRVYQGTLGKVEPAFVESVIAATTFGLVPDVSFLLDCDVGIASARRNQRSQDASGAARYDDASVVVHQKIRDAFRSLVGREVAGQNRERWCVLDASLPLGTLVAEACVYLEQRR